MAADQEALSQEAEKIVRNIGLPPCPAILTRLVREMRNDEPDFAKLGTLIGSDVSLAAALLKTVNSAFYGLRSKATSIRQALLLIGLRNVTQLVSGLLLRQAFPVGNNAQLEEYWAHSSGIARAAAGLARRVRGTDADQAYTFALFRDCGMPAMMSGFSDYEPLYGPKEDANGRALTDIEEESFGIHHAFMGHYFAKDWLLPEPICQAILWHHSYDALREGRADIPAESINLIALALAAEWMYSRHTLAAACPEWKRHGAFALERLSLEQAGLDALVEDMNDVLQELS